MGSHVTYEYMLVLLLYRVFWMVRVMTLHLGVMNGEVDTVDKVWGCLRDVLEIIRCPSDLGRGICASLCVHAFGCVWIVVYDVGGCHMDVVINCGEVN